MSFSDNFFAAWFRYHQLRLRLIWRAKLAPDFAAVMAVSGQMRRDEVRCLYELAQAASPQGVIVEIGSYRGLSTVALARGSKRGPNVPVFAIDPHDYLDPGTYSASVGMTYTVNDSVAFFQNILLAQAADLIRPINLLSWDAVCAWSAPISLLWIDGNHEYQAVQRDFADWSKFVIADGKIALHDAGHEDAGPYRVVQEACASGEWKHVAQIAKVAVLQRA